MKRKLFLRLMFGFFACCLVFVAAAFVILEPAIGFKSTPKLEQQRLKAYVQTTQILDKNGNPLPHEFSCKLNQIVRIDELNLHTLQAFVSVEDKRFFEHNGLDYRRIASAAIKDIKSMSFAEGASTITQQLVKNTHLSSQKKLQRKVLEGRMARQAERDFSKLEILEFYLNTVYFGNGAYGIQEAALLYFGVSASLLDLTQSAYLAAVINSPTRLAPPHDANERKNLVIDLMYEQGVIDEGEMLEAKNTQIKIQKLHYYLINKSYEKEVLEEVAALGFEDISGLQIYTYYDAEAQEAALSVLEDSDKNSFGSALVLDNASMGVSAYVSSCDLLLDEILRQPASVIKPILVYAPAFEYGVAAPSTPILDEPTSFGDYYPSNYRNKYYGWTSVRESLAHSLNVPALKLLDMVGIDNAKQIANGCGIEFDKQDNSLALGLGAMNNGVSLSTLADAYMCLANGGKYAKSAFVSRIEKHGKIVYERLPQASMAISAESAYLVTDCLQHAVKSGTAKTLKDLGNVAAKTGTCGNAQGNTDAYCISYTPFNTVAVWMGSADNNMRMSNYVTGATIPAKINKKILQNIKKNNQEFFVPMGIIQKNINMRDLQKNYKVVESLPYMPERIKKNEIFSKKYVPAKPEIIYQNLDQQYIDKYLA